ncbi:MAG TPA: hypothetical protein VNG13_10495 [Mycobacteriales bacterium]|nr:hypothetical protein [Mycobacteriales bacterium]
MTQQTKAPSAASYLAHPVIAVVDATDEAVAVWWVRLVRMSQMNDRICGAWRLAHSDVDTLHSVIARRIGLATTAGQVGLDKAGGLGMARYVDRLLEAGTSSRTSVRTGRYSRPLPATP